MRPKFVADAIESVPKLVGRLILLSQAIDPKSGAYEEALLRALCGQAGTDALKQRLHEQVLLQWLDTSLAQRVADLVFHFRKLDNGREAVGAAIQRKTYLGWLPVNTTTMHQQHFAMEMEQALAMAYVRL